MARKILRQKMAVEGGGLKITGENGGKNLSPKIIT
jgi:hypothetical protein